MRKVILYIAVSLDGYLADRNGSVDWLNAYQAEEESYQQFIAGVDTVVMGGRTYRQIVEELSPEQWVYEGLQTYVITHRPLSDKKDICFVQTSPVELIATLKQQPGKAIWICGGAEIAQQLMAADLIDVYDLTVVPCLLGDGIRLFGKQTNLCSLKLLSATESHGLVRCQYQRGCKA